MFSTLKINLIKKSQKISKTTMRYFEKHFISKVEKCFFIGSLWKLFQNLGVSLCKGLARGEE